MTTYGPTGTAATPASTKNGDTRRHADALGIVAALAPSETVKAEVRNVTFNYGALTALKDVTFNVAQNRVTAIIGPSGCGKSTLLRCFNRMHDLYPGTRYQGSILLHPDRINMIGPDMDPMEIRMRAGMVFQKPNPFPKSVYENVVYGLRIRGVNDRRTLDEKVETSLTSAGLWAETKDRLNASALALSGGQQQRLSIARALATDPEMMLFDEPTSALDPAATARIEDLVMELRQRVTILIVTHNMQQAARVSDYTAFMYLGKLMEFSPTQTMFTNPAHKLSEEYITGRFG